MDGECIMTFIREKDKYESVMQRNYVSFSTQKSSLLNVSVWKTDPYFYNVSNIFLGYVVINSAKNSLEIKFTNRLMKNIEGEELIGTYYSVSEEVSILIFFETIIFYESKAFKIDLIFEIEPKTQISFNEILMINCSYNSKFNRLTSSLIIDVPEDFVVYDSYESPSKSMRSITYKVLEKDDNKMKFTSYLISCTLLNIKEYKYVSVKSNKEEALITNKTQFLYVSFSLLLLAMFVTVSSYYYYVYPVNTSITFISTDEGFENSDDKTDVIL